MSARESQFGITCEEARPLMIPICLEDLGVTDAEKESFTAHLLVCSLCVEEYEETQEILSLLRGHWASVPQQIGALEPDRRAMTIKEGWEDLKRRCPGLAEACRWQEQKDARRRLLWRFGRVAVAASILIAVGIGWIIFQRQGDGRRAGRGVIAAQNQDRIPASAFAELVTSTGRRTLVLGQPIKARDRPQEVMLGGRHRVVMNTETVAIFDAVPAQLENHLPKDKVAYEIQLARGELYVEVVPGHSFRVKTDNALLTITGTKFNVLAGLDRTELTLLKGSVRFSPLEAADQWVSITAGYASSIVGRSAPSPPRQVDALAAVVWALKPVMKDDTAANVELGDDMLDLVHSNWLERSTPDLDSIDYATWLESHREWFAGQFPWVFRAQATLHEQYDIEADYVELLMISGDIWQFNYPRPVGRPIPVFEPSAIERVARHYKVEYPQLLEAAQAASLKAMSANLRSATVKPSGNPTEAYLRALKNWQSAIASAVGCTEGLPNDLLLFSFHASTYLANTRTAAFLWIRENPSRAEEWLSQDALGLKLIRQFLPSSAMGDRQSRLKSLRSQTIAIQRAGLATQKLLTLPPSQTECGSQIVPLARQLSGFLDELVSPLVVSGRANEKTE